ncbi:MAG: DNA polymerase III subunit delta' [Thermodesulfobacteriota bacterium]
MALSDVVGHARPVKILMQTLASGRVAHAYMFAGPDGVGKATLAFNFAKALQCQGRGVDACDSCVACAKVSRGNHPDVLLVEPQGSQIRIDQIRDLQRRMVYRPLVGSRRCVIMDRAHDMNLQAANALLKVLEEPPEGNVMILITRSTSVLPPTIVSRCQVIQFSPLSPEEVARCLQDRHGWGREEALRVGSRSNGSVKTAMELRGLPLVAQDEEILDFLSGLETLSIAAVLDASRDWATGREAVRSRLESLLGIFRDLVCLHLGRAEVHRRELKDRMGSVASRWGLGELLDGWRAAAEALNGIERNWNHRLVMDGLLLTMHNARRKRTGDHGDPPEQRPSVL